MVLKQFHFVACAAVLCLLVGACATHAPSRSKQADYTDNPTNPAMPPIEDIPALPRVLLIGDSISIGYTMPVRELLRRVANVHRIPENGGPTTRGLEKLDEWLGTNQWDVIHFNWGLHDLKIGTNGQHQVELEQYQWNLERLLARLRATGATLVWATTTPVPEGVKGTRRDPADVPRYNDVARHLMDASGVRIDDLYAFAQPRLTRIQLPQNVHFTASGSAELARSVASAIREALRQRRSALPFGTR